MSFKFFLNPIDLFLNSLTMYRLTLYYLIVLVSAAVVLGFFGVLSVRPTDIIFSTITVLVSCYIFNKVFAWFFKAATNVESVFITALILLLVFPVRFPHYSVALIVLSAAAMGSKYLLTIDRHHIFNPVAWAIFSYSLISTYNATWWIGTPAMAPIVLLGGLLIMRKTRKEEMTIIFLLTFFIVNIFAALLHGQLHNILSLLQSSVLRSSLLFFTFVMLTEPLTSPTRKKLQKYYSIIVAVLYATPQLRLFGFAFTPETALIIGNVFSYISNPRARLILELKNKIQLSPDTFEFAFALNTKFNFIPGQYLEWTLSHPNTDSRGNRRYFSIASAPSENDLKIAVKFYNPSSSYKKKLLLLNPGEKIIASDISGDFVLPNDKKEKVAFIAGGVGVAPYRSIIQNIVDNKNIVDVVLLFSNRTLQDIYYQDLFKKAEELGVKTIYILTDAQNIPNGWSGEVGHIDEAMIKRQVPDYLERRFYISGPQLMVQNEETLLKNMKIKKIITDFFPGYAEQK